MSIYNQPTVVPEDVVGGPTPEEEEDFWAALGMAPGSVAHALYTTHKAVPWAEALKPCVAWAADNTTP
jgi:hypothetical protein